MNIPVLATPMGKGVIPDTSPLVVAAARSTVLGQEMLKLFSSDFWLKVFNHLTPRKKVLEST
jgi:hypothetical protein